MFPASFLIDYIRVFQDTNNPSHTVGCSPSSHPTAKFIEVIRDIYVIWPIIRRYNYVVYA